MSWDHVCFLFTEGPGLAEKLATVGIVWQPSTPDSDGREDGIHFYKSADVHGQAFALASVLKGADGRAGGRPGTIFPLSSSCLPLKRFSPCFTMPCPLPARATTSPSVIRSTARLHGASSSASCRSSLRWMRGASTYRTTSASRSTLTRKTSTWREGPTSRGSCSTRWKKPFLRTGRRVSRPSKR